MAGTIDILLSVAFKGLLEQQLAPEFQRATGFSLAPVYAPAGLIVRRMREGAKADVLVVTPETMDTMIKEGLAAGGTQSNVARSVIGVAVRAGAPRPRIGTPEEFKNALIRANSVAFTDPATGASSGVHFVELLERFGIADDVKRKAKLGGGGPVAEFVARGEVEIAIQQLCEHMLVPGVDVVGPLPAELQRVTTFTAGVAAKAAAPDNAKALVGLLLSPHIQAAMPAHGLDPVRA